MLNRFFHHKDRGGSLGSEIGAGLTLLILAVCGIFINMQLFTRLRLGGEYAEVAANVVSVNGEIIAQCWFLSMVFACIGSLLLGLVARMPLVQAGGLGLSTLLISMYGSMTGLTYYNLLFVCFVSSIVTTLLVIIPGVNSFVARMIPKPVRRALPAAVGLLVAWIAIQLTGVFSLKDSLIASYGAGVQLDSMNSWVQLFHTISLSDYSFATDRYHPLLLVTAVAVTITVIVYCLLRPRSKKPLLLSLLSGTGCYFLLYILLVCFDFSTMKFIPESLFGRLWMAGGEDAMIYHLDAVFRTIKFGRIFTNGMDFSAFEQAGGNVACLFAMGILNFVMVSLLNGDAVLQSAAEDIGDESLSQGKSRMLAMACCSVINIAAAAFGAGPLEFSPASAAGTKDRAKSGIAAIIAAIGFGLSAVIMAVPFFFATSFTYELEFNMYGHYGKVMQLVCKCGFAVADIIMVIVGLHMAAKSMRIDFQDARQSVPFFVTVFGTLLTASLPLGTALGTLAFALTDLAAGQGETGKTYLRRLGVPSLVMLPVSLLLIALSIL